MMLFETGMGVAEYVHVPSEDDLRRIYAKFQEKRGWSCTAALHQYSTEFSATDAEHHADVAACMAEPHSSTKEPKPTYEQLEAKIVLLEGWLAERRKEVDRLYQEGRSPRGVIEMLQQELRAERGNVASLQRRLWDDGTYIRKLKKEIAEHREKVVPTFGAPIAGMTFPFTIDTPHRDIVELTVTGVDITDGVHRVHMTADIRLPETQPQEVPPPVVEVRDVPGVVTQLSLDLDVKTTNPDAPPFVDLHTYTASKMFGVSFKEVTSDMRNKAKTASFRDAFRNNFTASAAYTTENYDAQAEQAVQLESLNAHLAEDTENTTVLSTELVPFHGSMLEAGKADGKVWVIVRRVCEAIEIGFTGQHDRLSNPARAPWACIRVMRMHDATGREQDVFCIDMDSVPMWLATINASRVAPHLREKLVLFQKEAAKVLRDHFLGKASFAAPTDDVGALKVALRLAEKNARLVENNARLLEEKAADSKALLLLNAENNGMAEVITSQYNELTEYKDFLDGGDTGVSTVALNMGYNEQFLFSLMREHGLIVSGRTAGWSYALQTDPYKEYIDKGWFVVRPNLPYRWKHPFTGKWGVKQSSTTLITNLGWFNLHKMYGEHGTHWNKSKPTHLFPISPCNRKVTAEELDNYRRKLWAMWTKEALTQGMHYADIPPYPTQKDEDE